MRTAKINNCLESTITYTDAIGGAVAVAAAVTAVVVLGYLLNAYVILI